MFASAAPLRLFDTGGALFDVRLLPGERPEAGRSLFCPLRALVLLSLPEAFCVSSFFNLPGDAAAFLLPLAVVAPLLPVGCAGGGAGG